MDRLPILFAALLLVMLAALNCGESRNPFEAARTEEEPSVDTDSHAMTGGFVPFGDDFEAGLDLSVWSVEHVGNVEWTHTTENGNGYLYSPGQWPYGGGNRMTDIVTQRDDFTDILLTCDMRMHTESWHKDGRLIYFRCGNIPSPIGYHVYFAAYHPTYPGRQRLHIAKILPDFTSVVLSENVVYPWILGQWYSFKIQMSGNEIKVKVWPKGDTEPNEWSLEAIDSENSFTIGRIGFGDYWGSITDLDNVTVSPLVQTVDLDIKPRSCPNPLNASLFDMDPIKNGRSMRGGVLPVAILGSENFDPHDIDVSTVVLEGVPPLRHSYEDVATPVSNGGECDCITSGPDGFTDLTLKFNKMEIVSVLAPVSVGDVIQLTISGMLLDGTPFEGVDCVWIVSKEPESATD